MRLLGTTLIALLPRAIDPRRHGEPQAAPQLYRCGLASVNRLSCKQPHRAAAPDVSFAEARALPTMFRPAFSAPAFGAEGGRTCHVFGTRSGYQSERRGWPGA